LATKKRGAIILPGGNIIVQNTFSRGVRKEGDEIPIRLVEPKITLWFLTSFFDVEKKLLFMDFRKGRGERTETQR